MITDIKIQDQSYSLNGENNLGKLSKINIFVGANNSGKSRFLRNIFSTELNFRNYAFENIKKNLDILNEYLYNNKHFIQMLGKNMISLGGYFVEKDNLVEKYSNFKARISNGDKNTSYGNISHYQMGQQIISFINSQKLEFSSIKNYHFQKVYIPMLRGLRGFNDYLIHKNDLHNINSMQTGLKLYGSYSAKDMEDIYSARTRKDYKLGNTTHTGNIEVFTGLTLYEDIKEMLLGDLGKRELVKEFEQFLGKNFFEGQEVSLVPRVKNDEGKENDVLHIKVGENTERPIYDLGDGLQTIIINTFPLFKYKGKDLLLFIEEPEMTLHPGMQRKLLEVFNQFDNVQYFITTHSNHLLDISLDFDENISTYSFQKIKSNKFEISNRTKNKEVLDILGVRNSSVFLSNCIIWVEGISDRLYIKKFLELYQDSLGDGKKLFEEDKHFSILEYGGGNITHFNFGDGDDDYNTTNIESIQKNNFMVADNDGNWKGEKILTTDEKGKEIEKGKRLKELKNIFGDNIFYKHREIENILGKDLFEKYCEKFLNDEESKKQIKIDLRDDKNIDWDNEKIGEILKNHFISPKYESKIPDYYEKGTDLSVIGEKKADFARNIIDIIKEKEMKFKDLDKTAKKLIESIYEFIKKNNE